MGRGRVSAAAPARAGPARYAPLVQAAESGRAGAGGDRWCGWCAGEPGFGDAPGPPLDDFLHQSGVVAALRCDGVPQFPPQRVVAGNAKIATDVGDDGADRAAADLGGDLLGRGEVGEVKPGGTGARRGRSGGGPRPVLGLDPGIDAPGRSAASRGRRIRAVGVLHEPRLERLGAEQAEGDARQDQPDVAGAEGAGGDSEVGGDAALLQRGGEFLAVVDEPADQPEQAPEAALRILGRRGYGRVGHKCNKSTRQTGCQGLFSWRGSQAGAVANGVLNFATWPRLRAQLGWFDS